MNQQIVIVTFDAPGGERTAIEIPVVTDETDPAEVRSQVRRAFRDAEYTYAGSTLGPPAVETKRVGRTGVVWHSSQPSSITLTSEALLDLLTQAATVGRNEPAAQRAQTRDEITNLVRRLMPS